MGKRLARKPDFIIVGMMLFLLFISCFGVRVYGADDEGKITTLEELKTAIANNQEKIVLGADITLDDTIAVNYDCTIDGSGYTLTRANGFMGALLAVSNSGSSEKPKLVVNNLKIDGANLKSKSSAVYVEKNTSLEMNGVTIQNNKTNMTSWYYREDPYYCGGNGGAMYIETTSTVQLNNCTISGNYATGNGGGIYANRDYKDDFREITMTGCSIQKNESAGDEGGGGICIEGASNVDMTSCVIDENKAKNGGGALFYWCVDKSTNTGIVNLTDTVIRKNTATSGGGGMDITWSTVHLYGNTSLEYNKAKNGGACNSRNGGNEEDNIIYMHDTSSMSYNRATGDGGAIYQWEQLLVMYDQSCIHHNRANGNGGGVMAGNYGIQQEGGVIRDNYAGKSGGGVYNQSRTRSKFEAGMMYDNQAAKAGDDIYCGKDWETLYATQANRMYNDGDSQQLGTVSVQAIDGYHEISDEKISVPYYGWFIDVKPEASTRYKNIEESELVSEENDNIAFLTGGMRETGGKAIWYGVLLAYDANYTGSTEYQYDEQAYTPTSEATVLSNMFERDGYTFAGWNTKADGTGVSYAPNSRIVMDKSQVLYAQWEKETPEKKDTDNDDSSDNSSNNSKKHANSDDQVTENESEIPSTGDFGIDFWCTLAGLGVLALSGLLLARRKQEIHKRF